MTMEVLKRPSHWWHKKLFNPLRSKGTLQHLTLANARQFYLLKGWALVLNELIAIFLILVKFTLLNHLKNGLCCFKFFCEIEGYTTVFGVTIVFVSHTYPSCLKPWPNTLDILFKTFCYCWTMLNNVEVGDGQTLVLLKGNEWFLSNHQQSNHQWFDRNHSLPFITIT